MLVYLIQNQKNGKKYVGKTTQSQQQRWKEHCSESRTGRKDTALYREMREFGLEHFTISTLGECSYQERLNRMERRFIRILSPEYNTRAEGGGGGLKKRKLYYPTERPQHVKDKIAQTVREYWERKREHDRPASNVLQA